MVSSDTNGMWPSGSDAAPWAAASVICCAIVLRLVARSCAWLASLAASPAILSSIGPFLGLRGGFERGKRRVHDFAVLGHQCALHDLVADVDPQPLGLLVDHGRDEIEQVARKQRGSVG